ncbi:MAG: hypothetical protein LBP87_01460 [Planctomycetaceae bacterium]|nr:hypothetical protein [Planctomycetaceae bacterium]
MSYRNAIDYLGSKTRIFELCNQIGGRIVICPDWNGNVMTSTCDGIDGNSFGLINVNAIDAGKTDWFYNSYGGEDQLVFFPENGKFVIDSMPQHPVVRMRRSVRLNTTLNTTLNTAHKNHAEFDLIRTVRLLERYDVHEAFGDAVAISLDQMDVSFVGFITANSIVNSTTHSPLWTHPVSVQIRGMFNSGQSTVAIIPFQPAEEPESEIPIDTNFFGSSPHGRLRLLPSAALLRTDGKYRCQVTVPREQAKPFLGALDFREGTLTLVTFDMLDLPYSDELEQKVQAYNHGPTFPGETDFAPFYKFNIFSLIHELPHDETLIFHQSTLHINADNRTLAYLVQEIFGVEYEQIYEKMMR